MPSCSRGDIVLVRYPFADRSEFKVRPAVSVSTPHTSHDVFLVPLTSKTQNLLVGEFVMKDWQASGLNVVSAVKRGLFTIHDGLIMKVIGRISSEDASELERSLRSWLGL